jgi:hypothetical protein
MQSGKEVVAYGQKIKRIEKLLAQQINAFHSSDMICIPSVFIWNHIIFGWLRQLSDSAERLILGG